MSPKSERRAACGWRRLGPLLLALAIAAPAAAPNSLAADGKDWDPIRLWSEYPLDPAAGGSAASSPAGSRVSEQRPARAVSEAGVLGQEVVPTDEEASRLWALSLAIFAALALAGMAWVTLLLRKDAPWKEPAAPRRRRSRPPVVVSNSNGSAAATNGTTATEKPPAAAGGIRYRD